MKQMDKKHRDEITLLLIAEWGQSKVWKQKDVANQRKEREKETSGQT